MLLSHFEYYIFFLPVQGLLSGDKLKRSYYMMVWGLFLLGIFIFLALDLGIFNKNPHIISVKEASIWTSVWVSLSFLFSGVIYWLYNILKHVLEFLCLLVNLYPELDILQFVEWALNQPKLAS